MSSSTSSASTHWSAAFAAASHSARSTRDSAAFTSGIADASMESRRPTKSGTASTSDATAPQTTTGIDAASAATVTPLSIRRIAG